MPDGSVIQSLAWTVVRRFDAWRAASASGDSSIAAQEQYALAQAVNALRAALQS